MSIHLKAMLEAVQVFKRETEKVFRDYTELLEKHYVAERKYDELETKFLNLEQKHEKLLTAHDKLSQTYAQLCAEQEFCACSCTPLFVAQPIRSRRSHDNLPTAPSDEPEVEKHTEQRVPIPCVSRCGLLCQPAVDQKLKALDEKFEFEEGISSSVLVQRLLDLETSDGEGKRSPGSGSARGNRSFERSPRTNWHHTGQCLPGMSGLGYETGEGEYAVDIEKNPESEELMIRRLYDKECSSSMTDGLFK